MGVTNAFSNENVIYFSNLQSSWPLFRDFFQRVGMDWASKSWPRSAMLKLSLAGEELVTALYTNVHTCNPLIMKPT